MKVFLSHSSADKALARRLARDLQAAQVEVWFDQWQIGVGDEFVQRIEQGLAETDFVIVLLTSTSVGSEWVDREWRSKVEAEAQHKRFAIIPVRGEPCEIPDFLAQRSHADIAGGSYPMGFAHLLTLLGHYASEGVALPGSSMAVAWEKPLPHLIPVITPIALEVSWNLIPLVAPDNNGASRALNVLAPAMREALQAEFGFTFPGVRIRGNESDMPPGSVLILIDEITESMMTVSADFVLVRQPLDALAARGIPAQPGEGALGLPGYAWIAAGDRAAAQAAGWATWDAMEYVFLRLHTIIRRMASQFLDIDITHHLVEALRPTMPDLVAATVPKRVSWFELCDVLRRLVEEEIGIGNLPCILQALAQRDGRSGTTEQLAEQVRHALNGQITAKFLRGEKTLSVLRFDPAAEAAIGSALQQTAQGSYLVLTPQLTQDLLAAVREQQCALGPDAASVPLLVDAADVRPYLRRLLRLEFPQLHVLSRQEVAPNLPVRTLAQIRLRPSVPT